MKPDYNVYLREKEKWESLGVNLMNTTVDYEFDEYPKPPLYFTKINGATLNQTLTESFINTNQNLVDDYFYNGCLCTLKDGDKLSDYFSCLPYGIINKTVPGIGATSLEIQSDRNSIIVVPTKSLAYNKYKRTETEKGENSCMYIGSPFSNIKSDITQVDIKNYIKIKNGKKKKFLVVADSLPKLLRAIGEDKYNDYFLMIDEIDTLQTDSTYRPALENVIDYYAQFKKENRAVVSATIREFTHPELLKDTVITTSYRSIPSRNILLKHTNNEDLCTIDTIKSILNKSPNDKIVIAYNSMDGILVCIKLLQNNLGDIVNSKIGILCGEMSREKAGDYYIEISENNTLPKQIVFMTCAYFVGVDIEESYHSIAVSTFNQPFTLLSTNRLAQIVGRCRTGVFSETIIYTTKLMFVADSYPSFKERLLKKSEVLFQAIKAFKDVLEHEPDLIDASINYNAMIEYFAYEQVNDHYPVRLLRENINGDIVPSYFNIDALLERWYLHHTLYTNPMILENDLKEQGHIIERNDFEHAYTQEQKAILGSVKLKRDEKLELALLEAKENILEWNKISVPKAKNDYLHHLTTTSPKQIKKFYTRFVKFSPYFNTEYLADLLITYHGIDKRKYKTFNNSLVFWALDDKHPFKILILNTFNYQHLIDNLEKKGEKLFSEDISIRMKIVFDSFFTGYPIAEKIQVGLLKCFFKKSASKGYFRIIGLNPMVFEEPKAKIPANVPAKDLIKLFELK